MSIDGTNLYQVMWHRIVDIPAAPRDLINAFERLVGIVQEHAKYIILLFPEYTPHDTTHHLDHLFSLADRLLGPSTYERLHPSELVLLAFGLYAHDWGMAVSEAERHCLVSAEMGHDFDLLPDEPASARAFLADASRAAVRPDLAWSEYVRKTHGLRSGARLRRYLHPLGSVFADAVAKIAEGHTLDVRDLRDTERYPLALSIFGETVNLAALTTYVRIVDLLDVGDDRTPYTLWKFVAPTDPISEMEWQKHYALSPISVRSGPRLREVLASGRTDDPSIFAAIGDLRSWIDSEFAASMTYLRMISGAYDIDLDSRITWNIEAIGFVPRMIRFELNRPEMLGLLSNELYQSSPLAFLRELLQNSVDAIDARESLLAQSGLVFAGEIHLKLVSRPSGLAIEWTDNGIGMDEAKLEGYYANVGSSWYRSHQFSRIGGLEPISRFGVGILSCFAVSQKLEVYTRQEPLLEGDRSALSVEIPALASYFRIRPIASLPVGTTIRLEISDALTKTVSKASICLALASIARYVRHTIVIDSEEGIFILQSFAMLREPADMRSNIEPTPSITVKSVLQETLRDFATLTQIATFSIGSPTADYEGHFSMIAPNHPKETSETGSYKVWMIKDHKIDFDDLMIDTEGTLFVKGVQTNFWGIENRLGHGELFHYRPTSWVQPKLLLNVRRPSLLSFDLSRSMVRVTDESLPIAVWREVCQKLRSEVFTWPVDEMQNRAFLLGALAVFGGVPDEGLEAIFPPEECPVLVFGRHTGLNWVNLAGFASAGEFIEAPYELGYALGSNHELTGFGAESNLCGWEGDDALSPPITSKRFPWLCDIMQFGYQMLARLGWEPVGIRLVHSTEEIPFVCRVWGRIEAREGIAAELKWDALKSVFNNAPELMSFPASIEHYAAIGSRYWNVDHPKIATIVCLLKELRKRYDQRQLSREASNSLAYLTSTSFYGYLVPSRYAEQRLAIEVPNRLLEIAQKEGLACAEGLLMEDFLPGTVGVYRNPYWHDVSAFEKGFAGLGQHL